MKTPYEEYRITFYKFRHIGTLEHNGTFGHLAY